MILPGATVQCKLVEKADSPGGSTSNSFDLHCDKSDSPRPADTLCWAVPFIKADCKLLVAIRDCAGHHKAGWGLAGEAITSAHMPDLSTDTCMLAIFILSSFFVYDVVIGALWGAVISVEVQIIFSASTFYRSAMGNVHFFFSSFFFF